MVVLTHAEEPAVSAGCQATHRPIQDLKQKFGCRSVNAPEFRTDTANGTLSPANTDRSWEFQVRQYEDWQGLER